MIKLPHESFGFILRTYSDTNEKIVYRLSHRSVAMKAGLRERDHVIEINGVNISDENHNQVKSRITFSGHELRLLVVSKEDMQWFKNNCLVPKSEDCIRCTPDTGHSESPRVQNPVHRQQNGATEKKPLDRSVSDMPEYRQSASVVPFNGVRVLPEGEFPQPQSLRQSYHEEDEEDGRTVVSKMPQPVPRRKSRSGSIIAIHGVVASMPIEEIQMDEVQNSGSKSGSDSGLSSGVAHDPDPERELNHRVGLPNLNKSAAEFKQQISQVDEESGKRKNRKYRKNNRDNENNNGKFNPGIERQI